METTPKIGAQIYGYTVCLVSVITFLLAITAFVNALFDLGDPLHSGYTPPGSPSLASFENYKMDILKSLPKGDDASKTSYIPDDKILLAMYESAKSDKIQSAKHQANRSMMISNILIILCIIFFITHWRWLRKNSKPV